MKELNLKIGDLGDVNLTPLKIVKREVENGTKSDRPII